MDIETMKELIREEADERQARALARAGQLNDVFEGIRCPIHLRQAASASASLTADSVFQVLIVPCCEDGLLEVAKVMKGS